MTDDAYRCRWCGAWRPVVTLNADHEAKCEAKHEREMGEQQPPLRATA